VRWEALFDDLEAQLAAADAEELAAEVSDRSRRELARIRLGDRVRHAQGAALTLAVAGAGVVSGALVRSGPDWLLLAGDAGEQLISAAAVSWLSGLPALAGDPDTVPVVLERLALGYALRGIARDRSAVTLVLRDGSALTGTMDRVGADFVDVAEHSRGEARRSSSVRVARTVPFASLALVHTG